jgi:triacylglycerol lipase
MGLFALLPAQTPAPASTLSDKQIDVQGHRIHYVESGSGPPVVLLHGLGSDFRTWRLAIPALATDFHVYAIDQLGFGQSDKPEMSYRVGTLADSLDGFLKAANIEHASIVGNSLGGWVAALFTISHADRVDKLVLVDSAGYGEDSTDLVRDYLSQLDPATVAAVERFLSAMSPGDQRALEAAAASYFARRAPRGDGSAVASLVESIMRGEDFLGSDVKQISRPTLIVWGRNDTTIPLRDADAFARDIPGASKVILDGCGHRPQSQCSTAFNTAVKRFLTN